MSRNFTTKTPLRVSWHNQNNAFYKIPVDRQKKLRYFVIQKREISYRLFLHQHPFIGSLVKRLLIKGTLGLQDADTEQEKGEISLPYGVDVELETPINPMIASGTRITLGGTVKATNTDGAQIVLMAHDEFTLVASLPINLMIGSRATLTASFTGTPWPRAKTTLTADKNAILGSDISVNLPVGSQLALANSKLATTTEVTTVVLTANTPFIIPAGTDLTVIRRRMQPVKDLYADFFENAYKPNQKLVKQPFPVKDLDFTSSGAYSVYNWELFYHVPLMMAIHLSKNQRYAESQRWFHYLFDPTDDSVGPTPERFWKVRPFQYTDVQKIEEILINLATGGDEDLREETVHSIEAWKDAPFRPHVIARYRQQAYMYKTVMAYLDNLIAWGDSLFRQDTGEAIDEAMMLYVLAANILGPRPQPVPKKGTVRPQTYANLKQDLKQFGTVMRDIEAALPYDLMPFPTEESGDNARLSTLRSLGKALYFCVPRNDKLLSYWDTVADRLFKIRNSLNFQGVFRQLALFEPPIDPAMLAQAAAAGLEIGAIVNGLNQPLPLVRFVLLAQKAAEIAQEVKSLGSNLLAAMEKEDNESLAILRARHERIIMEMVEQLKYAQWQEASKSREGLMQSLAMAVHRYTYFERQLGRSVDEIAKAIPVLDDLDKDSLAKMKFAMQEPIMPLREVGINIDQDLGASGGKLISSYERQEFQRLQLAQELQEEGAALNLIAKIVSLIPEFEAEALPMGVGAAIQFGGRALSGMLSLAADASSISAGRSSYEASKASRIGSYDRREQEWAYQSSLAAGEITQIFKQLRAAQIREAIAEMDLKNHRQQMKHASEIEHFLNEEGTEKTGKKTNKALYTWMKREIKGLYAQCFQFAFDIAKKAERALQHELGNPDLSYLKFGYLAGKEGLLAGEKLFLDVKRMEMAYHELNQREYELTKHASLLQINPLALIQLRATGRCVVELPEALFDMDGPGHYFRRIKSVAVSIPCVTGPYASVNCTLTLLKSRIRKSSVLGEDGYKHKDAEDDRFSDNFGTMQSIVTSSAQNDSGLFETNLRDERYLPFENSGVISEWQLQLPADPSKGDPAQFDYDTISDVILHIRYTAREGGGLLRKGALDAVKALMQGDEAGAVPVRLFSVRHEFPTEWARFQNQAPMNGLFALTLPLIGRHYPFWTQGCLDRVPRIDILARSSDAKMTTLDVFQDGAKTAKLTLGKSMAFGRLLLGTVTSDPVSIALPATPDSTVSLFFADNALTDVWIAMTFTIKKDNVQG